MSKMVRRLHTMALAALLLAGCGLEFAQTGLACQHPPREDPDAEGRNPFGPGEAFADRDPTAMTTQEVATIAIRAGLDVTYRLTYGIGQAGTETSSGYSECWCVPPPAGRVVDLGFDSGGRLIVFVDSGQTMTQARPQPRMGWGCNEARAGDRRAVVAVLGGA